VDAKGRVTSVTNTSISGTFAPVGAPYLTLSTDGTLTNERPIVLGPAFSGTDLGAGVGYYINFTDPNKFYFCAIEDFVASVIGATDFSSTASGTGAATSLGVATYTNRVGVVSNSTGTTATGRCTMISNATGISLGGANKINVFDSGTTLSAISDGTNTYTALVGYFDSTGGSVQTDAAMFRYTHTENGGNWSCVTRTGGVETSTSAGIAPTFGTGVFQALRIVNNDSTNCQFYVDGTLVATNTTNIPLGAATMGAGSAIFKAVGTTAILIYTDWISLTGIWAVAR
jgi:hypothetical protein